MIGVLTLSYFIKKYNGWKLWIARILAGMLIFLPLTGYASLNKKFTSGTKADIGFFTDHTIVTIVDSEKTVQEKVADYADYLAKFKEDILYGFI